MVRFRVRGCESPNKDRSVSVCACHCEFILVARKECE